MQISIPNSILDSIRLPEKRINRHYSQEELEEDLNYANCGTGILPVLIINC